MKRLLLLPLLLLATPVRAEALTWKEFWEPFQESYHHGHSHRPDPHLRDWKYDHGHYHPRPRRRKCEVIVTKKYWVNGHYLGGGPVWSPGHYITRDEIQWEYCRR